MSLEPSRSTSGFHKFSSSIKRAANFKQLLPLLKSALLGETAPNDDEALSGHVESNQRDRNLDSTPDTVVDENTPLIGLSSRLNDAPYHRARNLHAQREESRAQTGEGHREPFSIKKIQRDDGTEAEVIVGESTLPQTVFNSSNVLVGIGMLSLPLALKYTGWVIGLLYLVAAAAVTRYTAGLLAKCLDVDTSLANFADIAYIAFGEKGRICVSALFTFELLAASVSLVVLFADSLSTLIPTLGVLQWKVISGLILAPLNFVPMRYLGFTSFLGLFCMTALIVVTVVGGCLKDESPGSLKSPATTYAWPQNWKEVPLSFGLMMAVWGGHSVFPNIYRDMQRPWQYPKGLNLIFSVTTSMDATMAVLGLLMFGAAVKDELTTNLLTTKEYPHWMNIIVLVLVAVVPLTKFPLQCLPIVSTLEVVTRIDPRVALVKSNRLNQSRTMIVILKGAFRLVVVVVIILISIIVPSFELVSALLGALFCFAICIILPCTFHLTMFGKKISKTQRLFDGLLIVICSILGIVGTVWEFLPKSWIEK